MTCQRVTGRAPNTPTAQWELGPRYGGTNGDQVVVLCGSLAYYSVGGFHSCDRCVAALVDFVLDLRGVEYVPVARVDR